MLRTTLQVISTFLLKGTLCRFLKKLIATSLVCLQTHWAVLTPGQPLLPGDSLQVPVRAATDEPKSFVLFVCLMWNAPTLSYKELDLQPQRNRRFDKTFHNSKADASGNSLSTVTLPSLPMQHSGGTAPVTHSHLNRSMDIQDIGGIFQGLPLVLQLNRVALSASVRQVMPQHDKHLGQGLLCTAARSRAGLCSGGFV